VDCNFGDLSVGRSTSVSPLGLVRADLRVRYKGAVTHRRHRPFRLSALRRSPP
jgi:hypothetical protein